MKKLFFVLTVLLLSIATINKSYANTIFYEDFTGSDGTTLEAHDYFWQPLFGQAVIKNNEGQSIGSTNTEYFVPSLADLTDYCVQANFNHPLPQTQPTDFLALQTREENSQGHHFYEMILGANNSLSFYIIYNEEQDNVQLLFQQPISLTDGQHTAKLCSVGANHSLYIDNKLIKTISDSTYSSGAPGFTLGNRTPIDNFIVDTVDSSDLSVQLIKQTSNPWQSQEYDSAHVWNPSNITINRWGCALTSATMVLRYYGINQLPDGTLLDPGSLNNWLKSQPDGYENGGWVNWQALSRLSEDSIKINGITSFDALEFVVLGDKIPFQTKRDQLTNDLNSGIPDILGVPGHFIVAKGINGSTFDINDPFYDRLTLNDTYENTFNSLVRFVPSHTDLSYLMITTDPNTSITVKDNNNSSVGSSFIQSSITDPLNSSNKNPSINTYYFPKPTNGKYTITSSNPNNIFTLTAYLYDTQGNPKIQKLNGFGNGEFTLLYNKQSNSNSTSQKTVTFDSAIQDIKTANKLHFLNPALASALIVILQSAKGQAPKHPSIAKNLLNDGIKLLNDSKKYPVLISQDTFTILLEDFTDLKNSL